MSDNEHDSNRDSELRVRKRSSLVWQYFEKLSSSRVKCRICQHEQKYLGNTANALRHLKVKHYIDVRPIGLTDPENVKRMKALNSLHGGPINTLIDDDVDVKNENSLDYQLYGEDGVKTGRRSERLKTSVNQMLYHDEDTEIDPYTDAEELVEYVDATNNYDRNNKKLIDDTLKAEHSSCSSVKRKSTNLMDERLIAETEYFREKAAYYRIQKHLAALQAKRAKYELDQLFAK